MYLPLPRPVCPSLGLIPDMASDCSRSRHSNLILESNKGVIMYNKVIPNMMLSRLGKDLICLYTVNKKGVVCADSRIFNGF